MALQHLGMGHVWAWAAPKGPSSVLAQGAMGTLLSGSSDEISFIPSFIRSFTQQLFTECQKGASPCQPAGLPKELENWLSL